MYVVIKAFEFDGSWYANITNGEHGAILHTTEATQTKKDAEQEAMDWIQRCPRIKSGTYGPFLPDIPGVDTTTGKPMTEKERRERDSLPPT